MTARTGGLLAGVVGPGLSGTVTTVRESLSGALVGGDGSTVPAVILTDGRLQTGTALPAGSRWLALVPDLVNQDGQFLVLD